MVSRTKIDDRLQALESEVEMEALGLAEVEHNPRSNRMRAV